MTILRLSSANLYIQCYYNYLTNTFVISSFFPYGAQPNINLLLNQTYRTQSRTTQQQTPSSEYLHTYIDIICNLIIRQELFSTKPFDENGRNCFKLYIRIAYYLRSRVCPNFSLNQYIQQLLFVSGLCSWHNLITFRLRRWGKYVLVFS